MNDLLKTEPIRVNLIHEDTTALAVVHILERMGQAGICITPGLDIHASFQAIRITIDHSWFTRDPFPWEHQSLPPLPWRREAYRKVKKLFGPFKEDGKPPYVRLVASYNAGPIVCNVEVHGAFTCERVGTEKKEVPASQRAYYARQAEEMAKRAQATEEEAPIYSCTPKFGVGDAKEIEP